MKEKNMVITKRFIWISVAVLVVLLGILAVGNLDYTFSKAIINEHSIWAGFFNMFGEFPAMFGMLVGTAILFGGRKKDVKWRNVLGWILSAPLMLIFSVAVAIMPINYYFEHVEGGIPMLWNLIAVLLAVGLFILTLIIVKKVGNEKMRELRKVGLVLIILVLAEMILVNVIKVLWARPRMRSIDSVDEFVHWYKINGPTGDNELKSFPSGHTANGFIMLAYTMFLPYLKKIKKNWFMIFVIAWGTAVAFSRVVLGAHFLSDVLVGGYITILSFFIIHSIVFKKERKVLDKNDCE
jgi:membrane-associated phospholipid phosphatase